jgi:hypothetical protein
MYLKSVDINTVIDTKRMRLAWHVASMGEMKNWYNILGNLAGIDNSEDLGVDGRIILEYILGK